MENNHKEFDERQMGIAFKGITLSTIVAYVYIFISIVKMLLKVNVILVLPKIVFFITVFMLPFPYYFKLKKEEKEKTGIEDDGFFKFDERKKALLVDALVGPAGIIVVMTLLIIFKLYSKGNIKFVYNEIGLITAMSATVLFYSFFNKEYLVPKTSKGKELALGVEKKSKQSRILNYLKHSFVLSVMFSVLELYYSYPIIVPSPLLGSIVLPYLVSFILRLAVQFIINYLWSEYNVKKKRKLLNDLE